MGEVKLNLARKWRSKQFDQIVGQDLSVRMLKNSLYLQKYFPVYLLSGQRGCGKTTTARVFAMSLNCEQLASFQQKPKNNVIPCLKCTSCKAMEQNKHPDFIEIDAASHTGVDNVRMLIDSASLLPLMGHKKIYLIDEAHMLSKAAFNALLKILEEPPASVIFVLATTDPQKIIDTVRSRCFQLFFRPVALDVLHTRLRDVCMQENITFDDAGLSVITKQTEGSVRDALNLLEQVHFASNKVSHDAVLEVLGFIDDETLIALLDKVFSTSVLHLLEEIKKLNWKRYSATIIWVRLLELIRALLWIKYEVMPDTFPEHHELLKEIGAEYSAHQLTSILQSIYDQEFLFIKTNAKHDFLEMILMQICQKMNPNSDSGTSSPSSQVSAVNDAQDSMQEYDDNEEDDDQEDDEEEILEMQWRRFIKKIAALEDPLLHSIFVQGTAQKIDRDQVWVEFSKELVFFDDLLEQTQSDWQSLMHETFGEGVVLKALYTAPSRKPMQKTTPRVSLPPSEKPKPQAQVTNSSPRYSRRTYAKANYIKPFAKEGAIDITDEKQWAKSHMIMQYLPSVVTEVRE